MYIYFEEDPLNMAALVSGLDSKRLRIAVIILENLASW